ncbi:sensor histidine kinase [Actinoplanes friuliensis]|uniref:histidine kinase n=1 Tax=Actinoplanes friuliensis DSM 7358 TaxID=1246995 RepID=U5VZ65_9ACTN|nr:ATP-binding protein [Actinoplanes friuliensis]AGZ40976.1 ATP-binding region ATPase domain-containing protein [Actinoplanes friuliensis DSM 7358]
MPDSPYLIAVIAVPVAVLLALWAARHFGTRSSGSPSSDAEAQTALAETRSELTAARAQVDQLTEQLRRAQTVEAVRAPAAPADGRHVEVFVNLSRRLQSLVHREIKMLDALENEVEDPDLLKGLFQVDHLATRIRRHAENLAVLGGSVSRRQWSRPVALTEVLRSAIAEVEHYSRVKLVPPIEGTVPGHAVASVIHLIAELIENATMFAPPQTQVLLRAQQVAAGVAIEVEDRGLGMQRADLDRVNQLLANPEDTDLDDLLRDGRIGLYVVSMIARQHGIVVQLQTNIYGGTQAVIVLPQLLLGLQPEAVPEAPRPHRLTRTQEHPIVPARAPLQKRIPLRDRPPSHSQDSASEITQQSLRPIVSSHFTTAPVSPGPAGRGNVRSGAEGSGQAGPAAAVPRQIAGVPVAGQQPRPTPSRPPLPRRRSQTHMAPQLQLGAPRPATEPAGEHQPGLMASFMNGVTQGEADPPDAGNPS